MHIRNCFLKLFISHFLLVQIFCFYSCSQTPGQNEIILEIPYIESDTADLINTKWKINSAFVQIHCDGNGNVPQKADLSAEFKCAWSSKGLLIYALVTDDFLYYDTLNPWKSDAFEVFIAPSRGSNDIIQITVPASDSPDPTASKVFVNDYRTSVSLRKIQVIPRACSKRNGCLTSYEIFVPLNALKINPLLNTRLAMQVYVNDFDNQTGKIEDKLVWYPSGYGYDNSFAMFDLIFTKNKEHFPEGSSYCYIKDNDSIFLTIYSKTLREADLCIRMRENDLHPDVRIESFPYEVAFPLNEINPEQDTVLIFLNKKLISIHELHNVSRVYEKSSSPGPFERQIRFFEACDKLSFPPENGTLFIGSSSIKRWYNIKEFFPEREIINRGFGGSNSFDVLNYIDRIVLPYKPSKIIYYEGDNDVAQGFTIKDIIANIDTFIRLVHEKLPDTEIYLISTKPSFARRRLWPVYDDLNKEIEKFSEKFDFVCFIDIVTPMLDENMSLKKDIFLEDSLHLNEKGYEIWGQTINNYLSGK